MANLNNRTLKIIELARQGIGGERDAAVKMLRRICDQNDLDFDEVINAGPERRQYILEVPWRNKQEQRLLGQICWRYAGIEKDELKYYIHQRKYFYTTTAEHHADTINAASILLVAFRKQYKALIDDFSAAFIYKHSLYHQDTDDDEETQSPPMTAERRQSIWRQAHLIETIEHVSVNKALDANNSKN